MSVDRLSSGGLVSWWKKALSQTEGRRKASIVLILKEGCQPHDFIEPVTLGREEISLTGRIPAGNFSFYQRKLAKNLSPFLATVYRFLFFLRDFNFTQQI